MLHRFQNVTVPWLKYIAQCRFLSWKASVFWDGKIRCNNFSIESHAHWLESDFDTFETRAFDPWQIDAEDKEELKEVHIPYWKDRTLTSKFIAQTREPNLLLNAGVVDCSNYISNPGSHFVPDYHELLKIGYKGYYEKCNDLLEHMDKIDPENMFESMGEKSNGFELPGWEPERMARIKELFEMYKDVDEEKLFNNLVYFLKAIQPVCEKYDIRMAIHPDDPAWPVFGLSRIITDKEHLLKLMKAVDAPFNGVTLCTGSLGSNPENDIPDIIRSLKGRIHFAHVRNLQYNGYRDFQEAAHLSADGSMDMYEIMKALYDIGFDGIIRPDHGRAIWGEVSMPGYGLYDRALGACYLNGLWEAIVKQNGNAHQE